MYRRTVSIIAFIHRSTLISSNVISDGSPRLRCLTTGIRCSTLRDMTYAYSHRDTDGTPWLDENMDPDTGVWLAREIMRKWNRPGKDPTRGRHYNHSTFIDLVMTGICGIRPSEGDTLRIHPLGTSLDTFSVSDVHYHGHTVDIDWNKTSGLRVTVDGAREFRCDAGGDAQIELQL